MQFLLLLALALFFVISVEGNLRGDHGHDDDESRALKKCKKGTSVKLSRFRGGVNGLLLT
jgi:hypothetical protein